MITPTNENESLPTVNKLLTLRLPIVEMPDTFKLSSSVCPVTSKPPLESINPVNVERPDTFNCCDVKSVVAIKPETLTSPTTSSFAVGNVDPIPTEYDEPIFRSD